jgi:hypothetical protein
MSSKGTPGDRYSDEEADRRMNEGKGRALGIVDPWLVTEAEFGQLAITHWKARH